MIDNNTGNNIAFDAIKIGMASPEQILSLIHISEPTRPY